jgi:hypothetical protein
VEGHIHVYLDKTRLLIVIRQENILFRFVPGDISMLSTDLPYDMSQMCITWQVQALSSPDPKGHVSFCHHLVFIHLSVNFLHFDHHLWNNLTQTLKVDYKKNSLFCLNQGKNMATMGNSCFWFAEWFWIFASETTSPNHLLVGANNVCESKPFTKLLLSV